MGYRMRMTLAFGLLAILSVSVLTLLFLVSSYQEFKADRINSMERLTSCLAGNIYLDMQIGDTRRLTESLHRFSSRAPVTTPPNVLVLDADDQVYLSNQTEIDAQGNQLSQVSETRFNTLLHDLNNTENYSVTAEEPRSFLSAARISRDGNVLGTILVDYPLTSLREHFVSLFHASLAYSLVLLVVLLVVGWLLGKQLVRPITQLRECMRRVGEGDLDIHCNTAQSSDEIGELAQGFEEMLDGLREKQLLEKEILQSERLVAVGQVAAGVAHEINNPLGGMLNAINTFKRHGQDESVTDRTMDLLERGLRQIQNTVQALLVQSRVEARALSEVDLEDLLTLIQAEVSKKGIHLDWQCQLHGKLALPSTAVRHILMNLLLNAIQAVHHGGRVAMHCEPQPGHLLLRVEDDGPGIPLDRKQKLFEPFYSSTGGHGLGLWVTYQTVSQLGGSIEVEDLSPGTAVEVRLPLAEQKQPAEQAINPEPDVA